MSCWIDHEDHPCSIEEHHAHHALGSSALRRLYTDQQPSQSSADLGNAVGWLAVTSPDRWDRESALVVQRPDYRGQPEKLEHWKATHPGLIGLTAAQMLEARQLADALQASEPIKAYVGSLHLEHVQHEHTVLATHAPTGVRCKSRPDFRMAGLRTDDLKITRDAEPSDFVTSVRRYGYHLQGALYHDIEASRYGLDLLPDGHNLIVVSRTTRKVGFFGTRHWLPMGRQLLHGALRLRAKLERDGQPPPTMWEVAQQLPPPSHYDRQRAERMLEHVRRICGND